jgi:hypothetical protein
MKLIHRNFPVRVALTNNWILSAMATMGVIRRFWPNHRLIWPLALGFGFRARWREHDERCSGEIGESLDRARAMIGIAIMAAVEEPGPDLSQIA